MWPCKAERLPACTLPKKADKQRRKRAYRYWSGAYYDKAIDFQEFNQIYKCELKARRKYHTEIGNIKSHYPLYLYYKKPFYSMRQLRFSLLSILIVAAAAIMPACKAKKIAQPGPVAETFPPAPASRPAPPPVAAAPTPAPQPAPAPTPPPAPDYNFANIQFEFNSGILKTQSYPLLDRAVAEMRKDPLVKFVLNGNSSAEGTPQHNMSLSVERANAVKAYLVNSGINADNLRAVGHGESKPVADNTTEAGRAQNRRVEIRKAE
jgi:OOP family OmpA-OmpF porin